MYATSLQHFYLHFCENTLCLEHYYWIYQAVCECGHPQVPVPKLQKEKCTQDQQPLQSASPPKDEYLVGTQTRQMLVIEDNSSLLTPLTIDKPNGKKPSK